MHDIPVVFHFKVEFTNGSSDQDVRFQEVMGLQAEVTTEELREGGLNEYVHRLPTGAKYGNLVLKRGFIKDTDMAKWVRRAVESFEFEPRNMSVSLLNEQHVAVAAWSFLGAWPVKWSISDFKAQENALAVESMELAYRSFRLGKK